VRDYFAVNIIDDSKVSCLICEVSIPRGGKEAKNCNAHYICHHLETKHQGEFATLMAKEKEQVIEKEKASSVGSSTQPTLFKSLFKTQPFSFDRFRTKKKLKN